MDAGSGRIYGLVDLGGTKVVTGIARDEKILGTEKVPTDAAEGPDAVMRRMAEGVRGEARRLGLGDAPIAAIGASIPGPNDNAAGIVLSSHNVGWFDYPFGPRFSAEFGGIAVLMDDDANCAGVGEALFGAGQGFADQVYVTISTGIGGAVIIGGRIHRGFQGVAGEVGHVTVIPGGPICGCGNSGCIEAVAAGPAIAKRGAALLVQEQSAILAELCGGSPDAVSTRIVFEAARRGDRACLAIVDDVSGYLGIFLAGLVQVLNPQAIILGGGVMEQDDLLLPRIEAAMRPHLYKVQRDAFVVRKAEHGDRSGLYGALALAMEGAGAR